MFRWLFHSTFAAANCKREAEAWRSANQTRAAQAQEYPGPSHLEAVAVVDDFALVIVDITPQLVFKFVPFVAEKEPS